MNTTNHLSHMSLTLRLAEQGRFTVSPNPMVGCVIVKNKQIIGQGFHQRYGGPHAEIFALQEAGQAANGASVYINLEPCCHEGKTPPCTAALIKAGIKNVYISCIDPNPLIAGRGVKILKSAGIHVEVGLLKKEATVLNEIFFYYITQKRPFVISKWAMSLDGKTSVNELDTKKISGEESLYVTHDLRRKVDAILVGANTILIDNPQLIARFGNNSKQPIRIILSGRKNFPSDLNIFKNSHSRTIIAVTKRTVRSIPLIKSNHIELLMVPENQDQTISLPTLLDKLAEIKISSLLVEGGMITHQHFLKENLVNKMYVYLSPKLIGSFPKKKLLNIQNAYQAGEDYHFVANLKEKI